MNRLGWIIAAAAGVCLALLPLAGPGYHLDLLTDIFFWIGMASAWNVACGYTGYVDFGSVTYAGIGSYGAGLALMSLGLPLPLALALGAASAAILAAIVGMPTLRLRGAYFAIATLALAEAVKQFSGEMGWLTGGAMGLTVTVRLEPLGYYYAFFLGACAVVATAWFISRSSLGLALKAIREQEQVASRLGVNTLRAKLAAYVTAAAAIGLLGGLQATRLSYFTPADAFNVHITIKMVIMSLLGGMGTLWGPVLGATVLQVLEDYLGAEFLDLYLAIVGAVIVGVILFLPRGILGRRISGLIGRR